MKLRKLILPGLLAVVVLGFTGCAKKNSVDTAPIEKSFQSADPATKSAADNVVASIKSSDYSGALAGLKKLASDVKLTPEQQQAVKDVLAQVQEAITAGVNKAADDAGKAVQDMKKSLPQ